MSSADLPKPVRLDEIIGPEPAIDRDHDGRSRIVTFHVESDKLWMTEACDDWYGTALSIEEVDKLIHWLVVVRTQMWSAAL